MSRPQHRTRLARAARSMAEFTASVVPYANLGGPSIVFATLAEQAVNREIDTGVRAFAYQQFQLHGVRHLIAMARFLHERGLTRLDRFFRFFTG